jgi:uncharacterized protein
MLVLNVAKIRSAQEHFERVYEPAALGSVSRDDAEVFEVVAPVALAFDIFKDKEQFRLAGSVKTTLAMPCSRCLDPLTWPVDTTFDLRYLPVEQLQEEGEREIQDDDFTAAPYENGEIDLGQLMREQFYLSLPMKPLCSNECRGLCPQCGTNLNRESCTCVQAWHDPRLAALNALKKDS